MDESVKKIVTQALSLNTPLLLAFDIDGTLAPIRDNPNDVTVPAIVQHQLKEISKDARFNIGILTGRDEQTAAKILDLSSCWVAVEHGAAILAPGSVKRRRRPTLDPAIAEFRNFAEERWSAEGVLVEKKEHSVGIHVRSLAKKDTESANRILQEVRNSAKEHNLCFRNGRAVVEVSRQRGDKGSALNLIYEHSHSRSVLYIGDDLTDFPAFESATKLGGMGIFVRSSERNPPQSATHCVDSPAKVHEIISQLHHLLR